MDIGGMGKVEVGDEKGILTTRSYLPEIGGE